MLPARASEIVQIRDRELVQLVDASLADATRRANLASGGSWLACRPGCTPCCHGVFRISMLDAERLRATLQDLHEQDPGLAHAVHTRAAHFARDLAPVFPGDPHTGLLVPEDDPAWESFADLPETDVACPALDPTTGRCDLYIGRPLTCRIFGPPVMNESGIGICELCYVGANEAEVLAGEMHLQHEELEAELTAELGLGETIIAWALLGESL